MARCRDFDVAEFSLSTYTVLRGRGEPLVAIPSSRPSRSGTPRSSCATSGHPGAARSRRQAGRRAQVPHDGGGVDTRHPRGRVRRRARRPRVVRGWRGVAGQGGGRDAAARRSVTGRCPATARSGSSWRPRARRLHRRPPAGGRPRRAGVRRLFPDFRRVERAYYEKTGIFPIMHTVVLKEELARAHPWLPAARSTTRSSKPSASPIGASPTRRSSPYVLPWLVAEVEETRALMGDDPFPYGVRRTRKTVETLAELLVPAGPRAAPARGGRSLLGVGARHLVRFPGVRTRDGSTPAVRRGEPPYWQANVPRTCKQFGGTGGVIGCCR